MEMPDLADVTHTMSLIYQEKNDKARAFTYAFLSAIETRTDSEKLQYCAKIALELNRDSHAIYLYNRAIKALDPKIQYREILALKMQKIDIYMARGEFVSIQRSVDKMIKFFLVNDCKD